jgi:hypothetical protein
MAKGDKHCKIFRIFSSRIGIRAGDLLNLGWVGCYRLELGVFCSRQFQFSVQRAEYFQILPGGVLDYVLLGLLLLKPLPYAKLSYVSRILKLLLTVPQSKGSHSGYWYAC